MGEKPQGENDSRRRYARVAGPFEGRQIGQSPALVAIYDLSPGGGFVNFEYEPPEDPTLTLKIALPGNGWVTVKAETVYRHPFGVAVRFVDLDPDTVGRLTRTVEALAGRRAAN